MKSKDMLLTAFSEVVIINDNNGPDTLPLFIGILIAAFIVYFAAMIVLDIRRTHRLEEFNKISDTDDARKKKDMLKWGDLIPYWPRFILSVLIPVTICFVIVSKVVTVTLVASGSMEPKLMTGNTAVYNRLAYINKKPQRGDIICFWSDEFNSVFAKRVIGIEGDNIEFHDGYVYINGMKADESAYLGEEVRTNSTRKFTVHDGCVFVLGDRRWNSIDSRFWKNPYVSEDVFLGKYMGQLPF